MCIINCEDKIDLAVWSILGGVFGGFISVVTSLALDTIDPLIYGVTPAEILILGGVILLKDQDREILQTVALAVLFGAGAMVTHLAFHDTVMTAICGCSSFALLLSPILKMAIEKQPS